MKAMHLAAAAASIIGIGAGATAQQLPAGWRWYHNARYGYSACYPAGTFQPRPVADAGDGRAFAAPPGVQFSVYGGLDALEEGLAGAVQSDIAELRGGTVSYKLLKADVAAISGTRGKQIYYTKHLRRGDVISTFAISYPAAQAARFNPIVAQMSRCFRAGDPFAGA